MSFIVCFLIIIQAFANNAFDKAKTEYESILEKEYMILPHKGNYFIPFSYSFLPNNDVYDVIRTTKDLRERGQYNKNIETEFQVSFSLLVSRDIFSSDFHLFLGYTQRSWWQLYNTDWSNQFRETNYSPEVFARKILETPDDFLGGKLLAYDFGFIHQSNGRTQELSRSWNRLFFRFSLLYGRTLLKLSLIHI